MSPGPHFIPPTLRTLTAMSLPTRSQFVLCQALDYRRRAASTSAAEGDCEELTEIGDLCVQHAIELSGLTVKTSTLENAGLGLFTTRPRRKGDYICPYLGQIVSSANFELAPDDYSVEIDRESVLSARYSSDGFARYANDGRSKAVNNCLLLTEATFARVHAKSRFRRRERGAVCLVAKRNIEAGAELLVSYGKQYWEKRP
jgi:hypothetical protein